MNTLWTWFKAKFGRLVTSLGGLLAVADLDISPIQGNLETFLSHKVVQGITVVLFIASFIRHQMVANQHPVAPLPDALPK